MTATAPDEEVSVTERRECPGALGVRHRIEAASSGRALQPNGKPDGRAAADHSQPLPPTGIGAHEFGEGRLQ